MYCTRRKVIFPFVLFIERKIPPKATPRAANAIYRETQLVRLDRTQPTLNTNNDITRVASDSARYFKHKRGITYYLDMILRTTHDDFLTFFFLYTREHAWKVHFQNPTLKLLDIDRRGDFHRTFIVMKSKSWDTFINLDEN